MKYTTPVNGGEKRWAPGNAPLSQHAVSPAMTGIHRSLRGPGQDGVARLTIGGSCVRRNDGAK